MKNLIPLGEIATSLPCHYGEECPPGTKGIPVAKVSNIDSEGNFHREFEHRWYPERLLNGLLVEEGELLVVKSSGSKTNILSGKTAYCDQTVSGKLVASNFLMRLKVDHNKADAKYVWHVLNSSFSKNFVKRIAGTTTYPNLKWSTYSNHPIPLPPLEEQRRIAAILDKAEQINNLLKSRQSRSNLLIRSIFIDLFGNPKEKPKNPLFSVTTLGERCNLFSGGTLPDGEVNTGQDGGFLLLKVSDMNLPGNEKRIQTSNLWSPSPGAKSATCPAGSIVIPKRGGAIGTNKKRVVNRAAILDPNLMAIAPANETITTEFLRGWFSFLDLSTITSGSSVPQLNKKDLAPLALSVPPIKEQINYKNIVNQIAATDAVSQNQLKVADSLFKEIKHKFLSE